MTEKGEARRVDEMVKKVGLSEGFKSWEHGPVTTLLMAAAVDIPV